MTKILLTGAAGFIGSHFAKKMLQEGFSVVGVDKFSNYYSPEYKKARLNSLELTNQFEIYNLDLSNFEPFNNAVEKCKPEYIVHFAAQAGIRLPLERSDIYVNDNILSFLNIIKSAQINNVKGILYASSSSVYGDETPTPFKEKAGNLNPKSFYGLTKLMNEKMAELFAHSNSLRMRGLRFFTVYGPWGRPDMAYFRLAASAVGKSKFELFGDGSIQRDFTYIDDVVQNSFELLVNLINQKTGFNDVVNIGGGQPHSINDLIEKITQYGERKFEISSGKSNLLDAKITMASDEYLTTLIGGRTFKKIDEGVGELMNWVNIPEIKSHLKEWIDTTY